MCWESQLLLVNAGKGHCSKLNDLVVVDQCQMFHFVPVDFGYLITGEPRLRSTTAKFCSVAWKYPGKRSINKLAKLLLSSRVGEKKIPTDSSSQVRRVPVDDSVTQVEAKK